MTRFQARFFVFIFFSALVFLHSAVHWFLFSLTPLIIMIPLVAAWGSDRPLKWIIPWVIYGELFSTSLPGVVTLVAAAALLVRYVLRRTSPDLSFSFAGAIGLTVLVQLACLVAIQSYTTHQLAVPGMLYGSIFLSCTLLTFVVCTIWMEVKPLYD